MFLEVETCGELFEVLKILPLHSQYIFSLLLFEVNNMDQYKINSTIHGVSTRQSVNLYQPLSNLSIYKKGAYCVGIEVFNSFSFHIKNLY